MIHVTDYFLQAGEDLEEDDEDAKESDEETIAALQAAGLESGQPEPTESTHLLGSSRSRSRSRRRRNSVAAQGNATVTQAVLMVSYNRAIIVVVRLTFRCLAFEIVHRNGCFIPWKGVSVNDTDGCECTLNTHDSFFNGGILFSAVTFTFIAVISLYSFLLLVKTKFVVSGSFGGMNFSIHFLCCLLFTFS